VRANSASWPPRRAGSAARARRKLARARWPLPRPALPRTTSLSTPLASARVDAPDGFGLRVCALCRKPGRGSDPLKDATATLLKKHGLMLAAPSSTYAHERCRSVVRAAASKLSKNPAAPAPGPAPGAHRRSHGAPPPPPPLSVHRGSSYRGGWNGAGVPINGMDAPTLQPRGSALRAGDAAGRSSAAYGADGASGGGSAGGGAARQGAAALSRDLRAPPARDGPDADSSSTTCCPSSERLLRWRARRCWVRSLVCYLVYLEIHLYVSTHTETTKRSRESSAAPTGSTTPHARPLPSSSEAP